MSDETEHEGNALIVNLNEHFQLNKKAQMRNRHIQLLKLADELIFKKGFSEFKIEMLGELSGCSRGTLYKSFKTKDALLTDLASEVFSLWIYLAKKVLQSDLSARDKLRGIMIAKKISKCLFPSGVNAIYYTAMKYQLDNLDKNEALFKQQEDFFTSTIDQLFDAALTFEAIEISEDAIPVMSYFIWRSIYLDETVVYKMMNYQISRVEDINIDIFTNFLDNMIFKPTDQQESWSVERYLDTFFKYEKELINNKHPSNSS